MKVLRTLINLLVLPLLLAACGDSSSPDTVQQQLQEMREA